MSLSFAQPGDPGGLDARVSRGRTFATWRIAGPEWALCVGLPANGDQELTPLGAAVLCRGTTR